MLPVAGGSLHLQGGEAWGCRLAGSAGVGEGRSAVQYCSGPRWLSTRTIGENHVKFGLRKQIP